MPARSSQQFGQTTTDQTTTERPREVREFTSCYKYVRRVRGLKFQARVYQRNLSNGFSEHVNLGLYKSEREAWQAVRHFVHTGARPGYLLPKFVYRVSYAPPLFAARVRLRGKPLIATPRCYTTPAGADRAMRRKLRALFGKKGVARFYPFG